MAVQFIGDVTHMGYATGTEVVTLPAFEAGDLCVASYAVDSRYINPSASQVVASGHTVGVKYNTPGNQLTFATSWKILAVGDTFSLGPIAGLFSWQRRNVVVQIFRGVSSLVASDKVFLSTASKYSHAVPDFADSGDLYVASLYLWSGGGPWVWSSGPTDFSGRVYTNAAPIVASCYRIADRIVFPTNAFTSTNLANMWGTTGMLFRSGTTQRRRLTQQSIDGRPF